MIKLDKKYVFHIPLFKFEDDKLVKLEINDILDDLIFNLNENGFSHFYQTEVESFFKSRRYEEILITIYTKSSDEKKKSPEIIFRQWFEKNNGFLKQESFAYEMDDEMFIFKLS